jgi:hypothetical protein
MTRRLHPFCKLIVISVCSIGSGDRTSCTDATLSVFNHQHPLPDTALKGQEAIEDALKQIVMVSAK